MESGRNRVIRFFHDRGLTKEIFRFDESTHDSKKAAKALGVRLDQIAKSILFMARGKPVLVVISGDKRVDLKALKKTLGEKRVRFARDTDVVEHTCFEVGAVSPVALPPFVRVLVDVSLKKSERIYPAAGGRDSMFSTSYSELLELSCAEEVDISIEEAGKGRERYEG